MSNQSVGNRVQAKLTRAVDSGLLPDNAQEKAVKLLARINQPVRLGLMGLPGSGKSTLLNLLVGKDILPEGVRLPTLQLSYGDVAQSICTLPDGSKTTLDHTDAHQIAALSPVFVEMQMPLAALAKISLLEVVAPNEPNAVHRASQWAAKRSDVALWCTKEFTDAEQTIWAQMSDLTKDHAFLMLTRADERQADGSFDATMNVLRAVAKDEFNQILPIATTTAIAARQPDGSVDKNKMRQSGGLALISAVLKQVEQGRQSAVDMADVLLAQNAEALAAATEDAAPAPAPEPEPEVAPEPAPAPAPEPEQPPAVEDAPKIEPKPQGGIVQLREMAAKAAEKRRKSEAIFNETPTPDPAPPTAAPATDVISPATRAAYEHVIAYLEEKGSTLAAGLNEMGSSAPSEVMAMTVDHIQWLCDYLNENGDDADMSLQQARDTAFDAADLVQLMQMEKRDSAALEAVTLMLQIKRELQANLAA